MAQHLSEAGDTEPAVAAWQRAGKRASGSGAMVEAERHYTSSLDLLGALPDTGGPRPGRIGLQAALGMVLWGTKGWSVAQTYRAFARAQELGERLGETRELVTVLSGLWTSALTRARIDNRSGAGRPALAGGGTQRGARGPMHCPPPARPHALLPRRACESQRAPRLGAPLLRRGGL